MNGWSHRHASPRGGTLIVPFRLKAEFAHKADRLFQELAGAVETGQLSDKTAYQVADAWLGEHVLEDMVEFS